MAMSYIRRKKAKKFPLLCGYRCFVGPPTLASGLTAEGLAESERPQYPLVTRCLAIIVIAAWYLQRDMLFAR
jgi:hypothetical protein